MMKNMERYESLDCFAESQGQTIITNYLESIQMIEDSSRFHLANLVLNSLPPFLWIWLYKKLKRFPIQ